MISPSKTSKRLGIVGAAAVVGLVPISYLAAPAFAVTPGSANLSITPTTVGSTATATDTFTTNNALPAGGTITINSLASTGTAEILPAASANYTVSYTPAGGGAAVTDPSATAVAAGPPQVATVTVTNPIPSGAAVTVTITGATNPAGPSSVYFSDNTSADGAQPAVNTNVVSIGNAVVTTPTVQSVNPTAYTAAGGEDYTVVGTGFAPGTGPAGIVGNYPVVCFVQSGTTAPAPGATPAATCPGAVGAGGVVTSAPATVNFASAGEIQGTSPVVTAGKTYNVVVYNFNPAASGGASYIAGSATSGVTLVGVSTTGLNVVPESGVRVVDTRNGQALPKGALTTGSPITIPITTFQNTPQVPTNVPATATGLALNVTAVAPASGGNIQVWTVAGACTAASNPGTATVNFQQPQDTNNSQILPFAAGATNLCVQDNGAAVNLVMDVTGYTTADYNLAQKRILDTRPTSQKGSLLGPLAGGTVYRVATGLAAGTYAFNVADVAPTQGGNLRVFPEPTTGIATTSQVPNTAVDTYIPNTDSSAEVILTVPASGNLDIYSDTAGTTNVVIDELGTFVAGTSLTTVAQPFRIYDSRPGPIAAGSTVTVTASPSGGGSNFVPNGALGVVGNLSDINPTGQGYEVAYPAGGALPGTATIANFPQQTRDTNSVNALNPSNGAFSIYSGGAATNSTFDVTGYIS